MLKQISNKLAWAYTNWKNNRFMKSITKLKNAEQFHRQKYFELKSQCDMIVIALKAGYTSKEEFFEKMKELNKNATEISKKDREFVGVSCVPPAAAKELWQEGFPDQMDRELLKKKTLELLDREIELSKIPIEQRSMLHL